MLISRFPLKKFVTVWGAFFLCVICVFMYLIFDSVSTLNIRTPLLDENTIAFLENKVSNNEAAIDRNKKIISNIRKVLREIQSGTNNFVNNSPADNVLVSVTSQHRSKVDQLMCSWVDKPVATNDINILKLFDSLTFDDVDGGAWKQGWELSPSMERWEKEKLNVFVVPHTHCDPGWLKTYEAYFNEEVHSILNLMVEELTKDKRKKFMFAEISFFSMWWRNISSSTKEQVKKLLKSGQLELVTGGWVMNDEATSHYYAIVTQLTDGHLWLNNTLGYKPTSHWSIDPFGYSSSMPYLIQQTGITSMLLQRVHYIIKKHLARKQQLEFRWRQQWDTNGTHDIMTHIMPFYFYDIPHTCGPDPKVCCQFDFQRLPGLKISCPWHVAPKPITQENVAERAEMLLDQYRKKASLFKTNTLLVPLGDDFRYQTKQEWANQFNNYYKLIDYINANPNLHAKVQFGTLSDYFKALDKKTRSPSPLPSLVGDFFSYNDRQDNYWTGFFTSRPLYKQLNRDLEHNVRAADIAFSLARAYSSHMHGPTASQLLSTAMNTLVRARNSLSLFQHHDGITGTAKDHVVVDYGKKLLEALKNCKKIIVASLNYLLLKDKSKVQFSVRRNPMFSIDETREVHDSLPERTVIKLFANPQSVIFFNSLGRSRKTVVTIHVNKHLVIVTDTDGRTIPAQVLPVWLNNGEISTSVYKVSFVVTVPAFGVTRCLLQLGATASVRQMSRIETRNYMNSEEKQHSMFIEETPKDGEFSLSTENRVFNFAANGFLHSLKSKHTSQTTLLQLSFVKYTSSQRREMSGAYLFLPSGPATPLSIDDCITHIIRGPIVSEVHVFLKNVHHTISILHRGGLDRSSIDIRNIVDIRGEVNFELAMRLQTNITNKDRIFYTDQNGFQMQKRKTLDKLPIQGNFYPMTTNLIIEDETARLNVMSGQSLGVACLHKGQVDLMLDRRLNQDDNRGLSQGVLDNKRTPNFFRIYLEYIDGIRRRFSDSVYPTMSAQWLQNHLIYPLFAFPQAPSVKLPRLLSQLSPLSHDLPCDIHVLTLRQLNFPQGDETDLRYPNNEIAFMIRRFAFDCISSIKDADCHYSNGKIRLTTMFHDLLVSKAKETSLTLLHDKKSSAQTTHIVISPMELKTYRLTLT